MGDEGWGEEDKGQGRSQIVPGWKFLGRLLTVIIRTLSPGQTEWRCNQIEVKKETAVVREQPRKERSEERKEVRKKENEYPKPSQRHPIPRLECQSVVTTFCHCHPPERPD